MSPEEQLERDDRWNDEGNNEGELHSSLEMKCR